jgi:hypothetical protein
MTPGVETAVRRLAIRTGADEKSGASKKVLTGGRKGL